MTSNLQGIAPLNSLGVIRAEGEDAVKFLHGQLTHDFALLDLAHARLCAFLSAKGRMQASFIGFKRSPSEVWLVCSRDLLAPTLKRLSMFVLRAKVRLSDATTDLQLAGIVGNAIETIAGSAQPAWSKADFGSATLVHLPLAAGQARALWVGPASEPLPCGPALDPALWAWGEVHSGVATLSAPLVDAFVPQMLNYESVDGVSFKKGCYPGQEVVARSQFRGAIKRRAYIAHADAPLTVGAEVFSPADPEQACGTVVQVAQAPGGGFDAIVSLQITAAEHGGLRAGAADGVALDLGTLPYPLRDDL